MPDFLIRIRADAQQFGQVIQNTVNQLNQKLAGAVQSRFAQLFAGGAMVAAAKATINYASQFNDSARKLGVGVEFLQEAAFAAKQTGASFGAVEDALKRLQIAQVAALGGHGSQTEAFQRLGVSLADLKTKNVEQIFSQIAAHIRAANPSAQQLADTITLLGRSADDLLPAFREGFSEAQKQARDLGLILKKEVIGNLDEVGDRMEILKLQSTSFFAEWLDKSQLFIRALLAVPQGLWNAIQSSEGKGPGFIDRLTAPMRKLVAERDAIADLIQQQAAQRRMGGGAVETVQMQREQAIAEARQKVAMKLAQLAVEQLSPEQQLNDLLSTRAKLLKDIAGTTDELKRLQLKEALADTNLAIAKGRGQKTASAGTLAALPRINQDQFARMGLYVTGGTQGLAQSQVGLLRAANHKLDAIKSAIDNNTQTTRNILD